MPWHYLAAIVCIDSLWFTWLTIWIVASLRVKRTVYRQSWSSRLMFLAVIAAGLAVARLVPGFREWLVHPNPGTEGAGVLLTAAGLGWAVWARVHLAGNWSGFVTIKEHHELIQSGPYRFTRHPIYTGVLLGILGTMVALLPTWGGVVWMTLAVLAFGIKLRQEEKILLGHFPEAYPAYKKRVRGALVPWVI